MAIVKVREYLHAREGQEVSYEELLGAGLAPSQAVLDSDLSRLAANRREGIVIIGNRRQLGSRRGYRYDKPAEPEPPQLVTLRLIGQSEAGNHLAQDDETMRIFEIVPVGRMLVRLAEQPA